MAAGKTKKSKGPRPNYGRPGGQRGQRPGYGGPQDKPRSPFGPFGQGGQGGQGGGFGGPGPRPDLGYRPPHNGPQFSGGMGGDRMPSFGADGAPVGRNPGGAPTSSPNPTKGNFSRQFPQATRGQMRGNRGGGMSPFMRKVGGGDITGQPLWGGPGMPGTQGAMQDYFGAHPGQARQAQDIFAQSAGQGFGRFSGAGSVGNQILEALPGAKNAYLGSLGKELVDSNGDGTMDRVMPIAGGGGARPSPYGGMPQRPPSPFPPEFPPNLVALLAQYGITR